MTEVSEYFDKIDLGRFRRAKELSEIKRLFGDTAGPDPSIIRSRATVVLCYACWEGFYNECVDVYTTFLKKNSGRVRDTDWMLLVGVMERDLMSLRDRNHSDAAKLDFVKMLRTRLESGFEALDGDVVKGRANLDFKRLKYNYEVLSFSVISFQPHRNRLDIELVGWRNSVAHGDAPDLSLLEVSRHVDFTADLLLTLGDDFQNGVLERR